MGLSTDQKGAIAELAIANAAIARRIGVYRPVGEGGRYDLIFDFGDRLDRVQCKWAPLERDVITVRVYSNRRTADGSRRRRYAIGEIDAVAAYCPELDRCFYLPAAHVAALTDLPSHRTEPQQPDTRDQLGGRLRVRRATIRPPGAVAQLGERRAGSAEVRGSIPLGSIGIRGYEAAPGRRSAR